MPLVCRIVGSEKSFSRIFGVIARTQLRLPGPRSALIEDSPSSSSSKTYHTVRPPLASKLGSVDCREAVSDAVVRMPPY